MLTLSASLLKWKTVSFDFSLTEQDGSTGHDPSHGALMLLVSWLVLLYGFPLIPLLVSTCPLPTHALLTGLLHVKESLGLLFVSALVTGLHGPGP